MDGALGQSNSVLQEGLNIRLNPYCSGWCSRTDALNTSASVASNVLILIVVDGALGQLYPFMQGISEMGLNPYCSGWCSRTVQKQLTEWLKWSLNPYCSGWCSRTSS